MPVYSFVCPVCSRALDQYRPMADRNGPLVCACGSAMERVLINAPAGVLAFKEFQCHSLGTTRWEAMLAYPDDRGQMVRCRPDGRGAVREKILCPRGYQMNPKTGAIIVRSSRDLKRLHKMANAEPMS